MNFSMNFMTRQLVRARGIVNNRIEAVESDLTNGLNGGQSLSQKYEEIGILLALKLRLKKSIKETAEEGHTRNYLTLPIAELEMLELLVESKKLQMVAKVGEMDYEASPDEIQELADFFSMGVIISKIQ
jgi:hypothetical protein